MKVLELFGSIESFSRIANSYGFKVLTLEINTMVFDNLTIKKLLKYNPDIIWASPPCKCFSVAAIGKNWIRKNKKGNKLYFPKTNKTIQAIENVDKIIFIIKEVNPKFWFIENPRGMLRKIIDDIFKKYNVDYVRRSVTYCQYGDVRMKPTDIWTNCFNWISRPMCKYGNPCHISAPRGSRTGTQGLKGDIKSRIPEELCREIIEICINKI